MTQLTNQLKEAQADQRLKSLQLREEALAKRESLLDDSDRLAKLELLDKQIAFKESQLEGLNKTFVKREAEASKDIDHLLEHIDELNRVKDKAQKDINGQVFKQEKLEEQYKATQKDLVLVRGEVASRKKYFEAQEVVITETIADWNGQLTGYQQEANAIADQKKAHSGELVRLEQAKQTAQEEVTLIEQRQSELETVYDEKKTVMKSKLAEGKQLLLEIEQKISDSNRENEAKVQVIKTREDSVRIKETAITAKELDLSQRERALNMKLGMV